MNLNYYYSPIYVGFKKKSFAKNNAAFCNTFIERIYISILIIKDKIFK